MAFPSFRRRRYAESPSDRPEETSGSFFRSLLVLALAAWALRSLVVAPFSIPSGSMLPTMMIGDYLFVSKWPYGYSSASFPFEFPPFEGRILGSMPERGDVVVFEGPEGQDVVKRVMGLPGDTIAIEDGRVILNSQLLPRERVADFAMTISPNSPCRVVGPAVPMTRPGPEGTPACIYPAYRETLPGGQNYVVLDQIDTGFADSFGPVVIPEGHIFVMGDNRDDSLDSRYPTITGGMGFVPIDRVVGRAELAFWSTDGSASWINPISWFSALRAERLGADYHP